ncbi:MAG: pyruvate, phosphate dikinase [Deltaproteobacteria bacterium]|nr:MAG: pyruvate, phosphate dikinase [Deltaproteobacteria bacterium]
MKYVYSFGAGKAEGRAAMKDLLGGKGANLAEMARLGLPVPAGFTISTEVCTYFYAHDHAYPPELEAQVTAALAKVEETMGARFGDPKNPLLVSVRSGARQSMPGMMDTVLNLGLNEVTLQGLIAKTNNPRFAWDTYRRFVQMYGDVVLGLKPTDKKERDPFEVLIDARKHERGVTSDTDLTAEDFEALVHEFKAEIKRRTGHDFPEDPHEQLWGAIGAVFGSWNNDRAITYRRLNKIPDEWGTAVNVVAMVYGNMGDTSATGVAFTRDPSTGEKKLTGEFLINAQGEDVVAGIRNARPIEELAEVMPQAHRELLQICRILEAHYRNMQDVEFTIQEGKLWMLQTRSGKRTGIAAVRIATEMVEEGLIPEREAILLVEPDQLNHLLRPIFDPESKRKAVAEARCVARGLAAGPGAACGHVVLNAEDAETRKRENPTKPLILVREETSPEDIKGMNAAEGILTARGGLTSHAALVGRQMGKVCVVGTEALKIDYQAGEIRVSGHVIRDDDLISIDGFTGEVFLGEIETRPSEIEAVLLKKTLKPEDSRIYRNYEKLMGWADAARRLQVRANADQPNQAAQAIAFKAQGIGLCRTEHMFFEENRIHFVRQMILAAEAFRKFRATLKKLEERLPGVSETPPFEGFEARLDTWLGRVATLAEQADGARREALSGQLETLRSLAGEGRPYAAALDRLLPMQREDFIGIFRAMAGRPVTIRTLDPPLHEFLPHETEGPEIDALARDLGIERKAVIERIAALREANPMLGHRGCRLGLTHEEITEMQTRAIIEAAVAVKREGIEVLPEIMIPLVGHVHELERQAKVVRHVASEVMAGKIGVDYLLGTMIEIPRAALTAEEIARVAEFFSFGTNDLTQTTFGLSRDDAGTFLPYYIEEKVYPEDPFASIDAAGVGRLMEIAIEGGRKRRPGLKLGICGEHGGDPASVQRCHHLGLDYVSCSPFRLPIARLAAAQAAIKESGGGRH